MISDVLPMTYAYDALERRGDRCRLSTPGRWSMRLVVVGCMVLALCLGAATLRRRTA